MLMQQHLRVSRSVRETSEVGKGCRGVKHLWKSSALELSGWRDKKDVDSGGAGIAISGSRKMHRQGWGCCLLWCVDRS